MRLPTSNLLLTQSSKVFGDLNRALISWQLSASLAQELALRSICPDDDKQKSLVIEQGQILMAPQAKYLPYRVYHGEQQIHDRQLSFRQESILVWRNIGHVPTTE